MDRKRHRWGYQKPSQCKDCGLMKRCREGLNGRPIFSMEFSADGGRTWSALPATPACKVGP